VGKYLVEHIDTANSLLIDALISSDVISSADKRLIASETSNCRMNRVLLDVIVRKSKSSYDRFLQCLKDVSQEHIAVRLEGIELRATVDPLFRPGTSAAQQSKVIELVRDRIGTLVSGREQEVNEIADVMRQNGFIVSSVTDGSILITFRCFNEESLANLRKLYEDKTLDRMFTQVFCPEFAAEGLESLTLNISDDEFGKCREKLQQMALMTPVHHLELLVARNLLRSEIIVSEDLLSKLPVTEHHKQVIRQAAGHVEQVKKLLDIISCRPDSVTRDNWTESSRYQTTRILPKGRWFYIDFIHFNF